MTEELFITCAEHLEPFLCQELEGLKVQGIRPGFRGVYAEKTMDTVYVVNYLSYLATRVLWPLRTFYCEDQHALYRESKKINWSLYLDEHKTFAIDANVSHPKLRHSLFASQIVKDALCDRLRQETGTRPSVDVKYPDVQLHLFIHHKQATISLDTSGYPLFKRGWKVQRGEATMPETLASALLSIAKYSPEHVLCDPFCGSGTILIEAAFRSTLTPPGFLRKKWGFFHLPEYNPKKWENFTQVFNNKRIPLTSHIFGADKDLTELNVCRSHIAKMPWVHSLKVVHKEVYSYTPPQKPDLIITDPPFGKRLTSFKKTYEDFAHFLRTHCAVNARIFIIAPHEEMIQQLNLPILSRTCITHGGLPMQVYELSNTTSA